MSGNYVHYFDDGECVRIVSHPSKWSSRCRVFSIEQAVVTISLRVALIPSMYVHTLWLTAQQLGYDM